MDSLEKQQTILSQLTQALPDYGHLVSYLILNDINPEPIFHAAKQLSEITSRTSSGYGQVVIDIQDFEVTFVRGTHNTKLQQSASFSKEQESRKEDLLTQR